MNLYIFLSNYCSDVTKSKLSLLCKENYTQYQFLKEKEIYEDDNVEICLFPHLIHIKKIKSLDNQSLENVLTTLRRKYIEYIAYPPSVKVEAKLVTKNLTVNVNNGNRLYIPSSGEILDLRYDMK